MTADRDFKAQLRELQAGRTIKERAALRWWATALHRAGLPVWLRFGRFSGPRDMAELRKRLADDLVLLDVFEQSYAASCAEMQARMPRLHAVAPVA